MSDSAHIEREDYRTPGGAHMPRSSPGTPGVIRKPVPVARIGRNTSRIYCGACGQKKRACWCGGDGS